MTRSLRSPAAAWRLVRRCAVLLALAAALPALAGAQAGKLAGRVPPAAEEALRAILDSARAQGLPQGPLTQRALEGASRGVDADRIVTAVRALHVRLVTAREALGPNASDVELVAAASALYAGVAPAMLERIHRAHPERGSALRFVVLSDIIDRGVPHDTAASVVLSLSDAGVPDESFHELRRSVLLDIRSGVAPALAASARGRRALADHVRPADRPTPPDRNRRP